jgi:CheY-like chemotaxis protein
MRNQQAQVLVVDDKAQSYDLIALYMANEGHHATFASGGQQALAMLREQSYDLVLLDLVMPNMNGYQLLGEIKSDPALKHIPVIMLSGVDDLDTIVKCIELGAEDFLLKPFKGTLLKSRINASLEKKFLLDQKQSLSEELATLHHIATELNGTLNPRRVLQRTLEYAAQHVGVKGGMIGLVSGKNLEVVATVNLATDSASIETLNIGNCRQTLPGVSQAGPSAPQAHTWTHVISITRDEQVLAMMLLNVAEPSPTAENINEFLDRLADHAGLALWNATLYQSAIGNVETQQSALADISRELKLASATIKEYTSLLKIQTGEVTPTMKDVALNAIRDNANHMLSLSTELDVQNKRLTDTQRGAATPDDSPAVDDDSSSNSLNNARFVL